VRTHLTIGNKSWPIEITLADRTKMKYQMLLGRQAMKGRILVDPGKSFLQGKVKKSEALAVYSD